MPPGSYQRVAADLRRRIIAGEWAPGERIPSWRALAAEYGVGQGAIRLAFEQLRAESLVEGSPRARLAVAYRPRMHILADPDAAWPHELEETKPSAARADDALARRLAVPAHTDLYREDAERLDSDGRPAMLATTWRRTKDELPHKRYVCEVRVSTMSRAAATILGLAAGMTVLLVERTRYDVEGRPVETADLVLPADRWTLRFGS